MRLFTQDVGDATFCAPHALKLAEVFNFTFKVSSYISMGLEAGVGFREGVRDAVKNVLADSAR